MVDAGGDRGAAAKGVSAKSGRGWPNGYLKYVWREDDRRGRNVGFLVVGLVIPRSVDTGRERRWQWWKEIEWM